MTVRGALLTVALSAMLGACALEGPQDLGASVEPIVGGTLETGRPEVVFMYRQDGAACTGSIIAPRVVLTANHCVEGAPPSYFRIYVGSSTRALTAEYRVSAVRQVPNPGIDREANDVALLILSEAARERPIQIARTDPFGLWGTTVTAVGYGQTPSGGSGVKYTTTTSVDGFDGGYIFVRPSVCSGDSGGPLIGADGLVYGVASFIYSPDGTTEPRCGTAPGAYNEIYRHLETIDAALEETGLCVPRGAEICNGEDDDCDETVDEGCIAIGEPCAASSECVGGLCADTASGRVCTSSCDALRPSVGCGPGFYCAMSAGCEGHCLRGVAGSLGNEAACTLDTECASIFCADPGDGRRRCLDPCRGDAGLCLAGEVCAAGAGSCGGCVPRDLVYGARGLGEPCDGDDECRGEMVCRTYGGISECASSCAGGAACPVGFECRDALCVRDRRQGVGGVCIESGDCGDAICAARGERLWCTAVCTAPTECPSGFSCVDAGGTRVCAPVGALEGEECAANEECVTGLCVTVGGAGSVCTSLCGSAEACAPGLECRRTGEGTSAVCIPARPAVEARGGCSAGGQVRQGHAFAALLFALGLLVVRRRR